MRATIFILLAVVCAGCFDSVDLTEGYPEFTQEVPEGAIAEAVYVPQDETTKVQLEECRTDASLNATEAEELAEENARLKAEKAELQARLNMKNKTIGDIATTTCSAWLRDVEGQCDLEVIQIGEDR